MKIVIVYVGYSGYFCACCRALASHPGVDLKVFARRPRVPFSAEVTIGVPLEEVSDRDYADYPLFAQRVLKENPDVVIVPGWELKVTNRMMRDSRFLSVKFLSIIDTSWMASFRQIMARFALRRFVSGVDGVIVGGERGRLFARWVGFPSDRIFISSYGIDNNLFGATTMPSSRPKSFLYVARYVPQKGIDTLLAAYKRYRELVSEPWPLHCYGSGPLKDSFAGIEGVSELGFAQPQDLPRIFESNGVYILPSRSEPWGVSLAEAAAAGMPLICSDRVTSGVDIVRHLYNGMVFPSGDERMLLKCLLWFHENHTSLHFMGERSRVFGAAYASEVWARRIVWAIRALDK